MIQAVPYERRKKGFNLSYICTSTKPLIHVGEKVKYNSSKNFHSHLLPFPLLGQKIKKFSTSKGSDKLNA